MKTLSLSKVAKIRSGFSFREKIREVEKGDVRLLQIRDLRQQQTPLKLTRLCTETLPQINWTGKSNALLEPPSVLIPARGDYHLAALFDASTKVIASSQLLIIRSTCTRLIPAYLCWFLNQKTTQHFLVSESRGSKMSLLSRASLAAMPIDLPPLLVQQKIIRLQQIWEQEQQMIIQLQLNREEMIKGLFQQLMCSGTTSAEKAEDN